MDSFVRRLEQLCATADVDELVASYRGLPLYPDGRATALRAAEGVRTNMKVVFEAVAHRNPYPAEQLPEDAWNQMVLKALFVGSALRPDRRPGPPRQSDAGAHAGRLRARALGCRRGRSVRNCGAASARSPRGALLADLARVLDKGTPPERAAAVLALRRATDPTRTPLAARPRRPARRRRCALASTGASLLEFT